MLPSRTKYGLESIIGRPLSYEVLLKSIVQAILTYAMRVYSLYLVKSVKLSIHPYQNSAGVIWKRILGYIEGNENF